MTVLHYQRSACSEVTASSSFLPTLSMPRNLLSSTATDKLMMRTFLSHDTSHSNRLITHKLSCDKMIRT